MSKLTQVFKQTKPCIGYLTAGDGGTSYTIEAAKALIQGGVDILELGFPFSDPVADNPEIQVSHDRALAENLTSETLLEIVEGIRAFNQEVPLILYSYYNPLLQRDLDYLRRLKDAGINGVCVIDLPAPLSHGEKSPFFEDLLAVGLDPILLISAGTTPERMSLIQEYARGFLYYIPCQATRDSEVGIKEEFRKVREHFDLPIVDRRDICDKKEAAHVLNYSDGFIVKTAFVHQTTMDSSVETLTALAQTVIPG
uniref:tryptophan synthase n=1 Tax=Chlamydia trachomatis TaxID=813 RepID=Q8KQD8_CHLTH|nr:tryptophan synthase alpha chain [Chlamydia trachomatis]AFB18263.1 tryptophan synthase alpha subunit [Chlamydia trachomatis]ANF04033.1 tryptophan synthase A subunit [Chlamydia trachomatis]ANF04034.1 tryptophan synthase A subunit [Chlamydia trachomatis]ANF04035.1 tryptophan synthase A subunit [Chlamydia trachomatis]